MKIFLLLLWAFFMICMYKIYDIYEGDIAISLSSIFPPKYSVDNPSIQTVSSLNFRQELPKEEPIKGIPNKKYIYKPKPFELDDTESLRSLNLTCTPDSFGYSYEIGLEIFPHHGYPKCSSVHNQSDTYLHIDRTKNLMYMDCPNGKGQFVKGPVNHLKIAKSDELDSKWEVEDYEEPVDFSNFEFGLGTCEEDEPFMQASMSPVFNQTAFKKARSLTTSKPRIIYFLTLDSMSRRHTFRKTPKIIEFLNELNENHTEYASFDFKLHNILGPNSVSNQVPIMGKQKNFVNDFQGDQDIDYLGKDAIWNKLRKKGYISMMGLENCDNYFPCSLGRSPDVDYSVGPFYCAVQKYSATSFDKEFTLTQRCLGGHQTHYYILNYTKDVVEINQGANIFLYNHLNAAHEATGLHAETLNDDITDFLKDFLHRFGRNNDIFIFLQADHGMRYGNWFKDLDAYQENKLPSLFIIANKALLEAFPYSYHSLHMNTERLTSKPDLRETALYLSGIIEKSSTSVNLLTQIAPKSRSCNDIGIDAWDCSCTKMTEITSPTPSQLFLLEALKNYAEQTINSFAYSSPLYPLGKVCKYIKLEEFTKIYHVGVSNIHEFFKLEITSSTQKNMKFQINFFISADSLNMRSRSYMYRIERSGFGSAPIRIRILNISRMDRFAGKCEIVARNSHIKPEFCACQDWVELDE